MKEDASDALVGTYKLNFVINGESQIVMVSFVESCSLIGILCGLRLGHRHI